MGVRPGDGGLLCEERDPGVARRRPSPGRTNPGLVAVQRDDGERRGHPVWGGSGRGAKGVGGVEPGVCDGVGLDLGEGRLPRLLGGNVLGPGPHKRRCPGIALITL